MYPNFAFNSEEQNTQGAELNGSRVLLQARPSVTMAGRQKMWRHRCRQLFTLDWTPHKLQCFIMLSSWGVYGIIGHQTKLSDPWESFSICNTTQKLIITNITASIFFIKHVVSTNSTIKISVYPYLVHTDLAVLFIMSTFTA